MKFIDRTAPLLENTGDYPERWHDLIGQVQAKDLLQVTAAGARARREAMEHVLLTGPPGIGKTALAYCSATELRRPARIYTGSMKVDLARLLFSEMADRDVLVYDEAHKLADGGARHAEWMLDYVQDGRLPGPRDRERTPRITLILATSMPGKLPPALLRRFLRPQLVDYSPEDAAKIVTVLSARILAPGPKVTGKDARLIADAANGNPRAIRNHLRLLRNMLDAKKMRNGYDIPMLLAFQGLTADGLDNLARQYLQVLADDFQGQAGGANLTDRLGDVGEVESLLVRRGYIAKTPKGRVLTQAGIRRYHQLEEAS